LKREPLKCGQDASRRRLRFDDERVDAVDAARVARDGLGTAFSPTQSMGAYLLQYVRKADVAKLLRGRGDTEL
jgi:hypothetical protein